METRDNIKFARKCDCCEQGMNQGYITEIDYAYYCSDKCLHSEYTEAECEEMSKNDEIYWTDWECDYQYELINGILTEIE